MLKTPQQLSPLLSAACSAALAHLENLHSTSVAATVDVKTLRSRLQKNLDQAGISPDQVISELVADVQGGILGNAGPRFFGWVIGGSLPAALAADWLTSAWDQNAALYACAPAAAIVEEVVGLWLKQILNIPDAASFALVSGCQMAHLTCLASARHHLLEQRGWDVEAHGLFGAPPIRIFANAQRHGSIERAARLLGFGQAQVQALATDSLGRVQPAALQSALAGESDSPTIVVLQAGDIATGACDDFATLIPIAKKYSAWVHVDGAFGLWAAASPQHCAKVAGAENADSWATDGHKWLNVPFDCGYAFVAHPAAHRATMSHRAPYITFDAEARDQIDWNPEWSRRARGFPSYAALRQLGRDGIASLIDRCCLHAHSLVMRMGQLPGVEVLCEPTLNQGLLRFLSANPDATEADHARRTDEIMSRVALSGEAFFTGSEWQGHRVMRVSVCNWQTSEADVDRTVAAVRRALSEN